MRGDTTDKLSPVLMDWMLLGVEIRERERGPQVRNIVLTNGTRLFNYYSTDTAAALRLFLPFTAPGQSQIMCISWPCSQILIALMYPYARLNCFVGPSACLYLCSKNLMQNPRHNIHEIIKFSIANVTIYKLIKYHHPVNISCTKNLAQKVGLGCRYQKSHGRLSRNN